MLADFLSVLPFPLSSPPLPFCLPFPSLPFSPPSPSLSSYLSLAYACVLRGGYFPICGHIDVKGQYCSTLHWRQTLSLDWSSVIQLDCLPANLRDPPVFSSLVLGVFMPARQFTYGVSTQPSLPFLNLRLFAGGRGGGAGGGGAELRLDASRSLHVDVAIVTHCQIQSIILYPRMKSQLIIYLVKMWLEKLQITDDWERVINTAANSRVVFPGMC